MLPCFRLLLATCVTCFSLVGVSGEQPLSRTAIAETQTKTRPVEPAKSSENWAEWLWILAPFALGGSFLFGVSQGIRKAGITPSDPESDASAPALPSETCDDRSLEASMTATTRLTKADRVVTLIADLHSLNADKRRQGIWELGQHGDSRAIQPLVDLLMVSDSMQRSLILAAVSEIVVRSLQPMNRALVLSLQDQSPDVRKNAIRDVTRIYEAMAQMSQLLQYAVSDTDREVRDTAQWALSQMIRIRSLPDSKSLPDSPPIPSTAEQLSGEDLSHKKPGEQNSQI